MLVGVYTVFVCVWATSNLTTIDESGSILSPSDISFDKTEEDLDDDYDVHVPRNTAKRRPSAPPETDDDDDNDMEPSGKRSRHVAVRISMTSQCHVAATIITGMQLDCCALLKEYHCEIKPYTE